MRLAGRITDWNDDRGSGFVMPNAGGTRAFVHINEFQRASRRPVAGDMISSLPSVDMRGRTNARKVRHAGQKIEVPRVPSRVPRAALGVCALLSGGVAAVSGSLPTLLIAAYYASSLLSYFMYRSDKVAAQGDAQRTPEASLHLADLLGGWPGALIAQQQFRHKTVKQLFQITFWASVLINLAAVTWLHGSGVLVDLVGRASGQQFSTRWAALETSMESMDLLLLLPIAIFAFVNVVATRAVLLVSDLPASQRALQLAFIWLVPILGSVVCLSSASHATRGFSATLPSDGSASSGQDGGGHGDGGSSSCGDSGGGDGGGGGC